MTKNYWNRDPKYTSAFNFNEKGLEILDNNGNVALNIDLGVNTIKLQGYFLFPEINYVIILGKNSTVINTYQNCQNEKYFDSLIQEAGVKRLFAYDGSHGFGVRTSK